MSEDDTLPKVYRIPNSQVEDAADQFDQARRILQEQGPGSGILLPQLHAAAMALELYLKSLASYDTQDGDTSKAYIVRATPDSQTHSLTDLLSRVPADYREVLLTAFRSHNFKHVKGSLGDALKPFNGLVVTSRYPFHQGLKTGPLAVLNELVDFFHDFVSGLEKELARTCGN